MIFPETSDTFLPCNKDICTPISEDELDTSKMVKRKESNGTEVLVDLKTKKVFFKKKNADIFPLDLPVQVDMEITQKCNLNCKHCFVTSKKTPFSETTFDVIKKLADEGVIIFELIGGEPLLVKEIFEIIDYLKKRQKIVTISTNGTLINKGIAQKLFQNPPNKIFVSLDGPREINDFIRGQGSFSRSIRGIKELNRVGITPTISFCVNRLNIIHINNFVEEIKDLKIKSIFFILGEKPANSDSFSKYFFNHSERENVRDFISNLNIPIKYSMHFAPKGMNALYYGCFFRLTMCEITPLGDVLSCPIIRRKEGNVLENRLKDIWKNMQSNLISNKEAKCKKCKWSGRCYPCEFDRIDD